MSFTKKQTLPFALSYIGASAALVVALGLFSGWAGLTMGLLAGLVVFSVNLGLLMLATQWFFASINPDSPGAVPKGRLMLLGFAKFVWLGAATYVALVVLQVSSLGFVGGAVWALAASTILISRLSRGLPTLTDAAS